MNPDYPNVRGCFIDPYSKPGTFTVVDYPTWHAKNGNFVPCANPPIADGSTWQQDFSTKDAATSFAASNNYVVCQLPHCLDPKRRDKKPQNYEADNEDTES